MPQQRARIVKAPDVMGGEPRVDGRRITVPDIYEQVEGRGLEPQTVADKYDLDVAGVYRALAYYREHPKEMNEVREGRRGIIEKGRKRSPTPDGLDSNRGE
ncbi:DUF433 domain-containing protein [Halomarina halobia]|uniref:DUF433 domain-containing protein n=1 Tax=Halomarina halobia TaxID=3033386 RepID=A0ABD6ABH1_9EURY|nr:DUF433 domain-containing protein [Halomarina sp. PSR21]